MQVVVDDKGKNSQAKEAKIYPESKIPDSVPCEECKSLKAQADKLQEELGVLREWLHLYNSVVSRCETCSSKLAEAS